MIVVDTNVLLDLFSPDSDACWSVMALAEHRHERLIINPVIRAEFAPRFRDVAHQSEYLADLAIVTVAIDDHAAFRAGQAHNRYRHNGGKRIAMLADFLIGGHAAMLGAALMTRDRGRFARYFPELTLITPETYS